MTDASLLTNICLVTSVFAVQISAQGTKIISPALSHRLSAIFQPGYIYFDLSVKSGAPCIATCTFQNMNKNRGITTNPIRVDVATNGYMHTGNERLSVGMFKISCGFKNTYHQQNAKMTIIVHAKNKISLQVQNDCITVGNELVAKFDFSHSAYINASKVIIKGFYNAEIINRKFVLGTATEYKPSSYEVSQGFTIKVKMTKTGKKVVRFRLLIDSGNGKAIVIEKTATVTVKGLTTPRLTLLRKDPVGNAVAAELAGAITSELSGTILKVISLRCEIAHSGANYRKVIHLRDTRNNCDSPVNDSFENYLQWWSTPSVRFYHGKVALFCTILLKHQFKHFGVYVIRATAKIGTSLVLSQETICISKFTPCPIAPAKISGPSKTGFMTFIENRDVFLTAKYEEAICHNYVASSPKKSKMVWRVLRFKDGIDEIDHYSPTDKMWNSIIMYGKTLFISGGVMELGTYRVIFKVSYPEFCGKESFSTSDQIIMKIVPPRLQAKIKGGSESVLYTTAYSNIRLESELRYPGQEVTYHWYCRAADEEDQFLAFYQTTTSDLGSGCFGNGFMVSPYQGDPSKVDISVSKFTGSGKTYRVRLSVSDSNTEAHDDYNIILQKANTGANQIFNHLRKKTNVVPRVVINCLKNCHHPYITSGVLHLQASCKNCVDDISKLPFTLLYEWKIELPQSTPGYPKNLYWEDVSYSQNDGQEDVRFKPFAFIKSGKYKIISTMVAKDKKTNASVSVGTAHYHVDIVEKPPPSSCFIVPIFGLALFTKFEIGCHEDPLKDSSLHQMFYSSCCSCNEDNSYTLFYQGYGNIAKDVVLRMGEESFGYRLVIKIRIHEIYGAYSDSYIDVHVFPQNNPKFESILSMMGEFSALRGNDVVNLVEVGTAALSVTESVQDKTFSYNVVNTLISKLETIKPTHCGAAKLLAEITKTITSVILRDNEQFFGEIPTMLQSIEKATSLQTKYLTEAQKSNCDFGILEDVARDVMSAIVNGLRMETNQRTTSVPSKLTHIFSRNLYTISLDLARAKLIGEKHSVVSADGFQATFINSRKENTKFFSQQPGLAIGRWDPIDGQTDFDIKSGVIILPFNPLSNKLVGKPGAIINISSVVGISFDAKPVTTAIKTWQGGPIVQDALWFLSKRSIHTLVPLPEEAFTASQRIKLPQPCSSENSNGLSSSAASVTMPCGYVMAETTFDTSRSSQTTSKNPSFIVIRPSRPCRVLIRPCVKISFLSDKTKVPGQTVKLENGKCAPDEIKLKLSKCFTQYRVLLNDLLPRSSSSIESSGFEPDPWAIPATRELLDAISAGENVITMMEYLQRDYLSIDEDTGFYQDIYVKLIKSRCMLWDEINQGWSGKLCTVKGLLKGDAIHCQCDRQKSVRGSFNTRPTAPLKEPLYFAADVVIVPNEIDFKDIVNLFLRLRVHYYMLLVFLTSWILFIIALIWARRADVKESSSKGIIICPDIHAGDFYLYEVAITTGLLRGSGTTANVSIVLEGNDGLKSTSCVIAAKEHDSFQRSSRDSFLIAAPKSLGRVEKIHLKHDNSGDDPCWHVNRIAVFDLHNKECPPSYFLVNSWLSRDIFPYRCHITVEITPVKELLSFKTLWKIYLAHMLNTNDVWLSIFFKPSSSPFTRVQRLACMACAYFGTMLVTNMFMEVGSEYYTMKMGFVQVDLSPIIIALEGCIITAPLSFLHATVFNRIETHREKELNHAMGILYEKWSKLSNNFDKPWSSEHNAHRIPSKMGILYEKWSKLSDNFDKPGRNEHNAQRIPSKMPRVKTCTVEELDSGNIHDFTGYQSHHEGFDVLNTPRRQSNEIERIAKESKRLGSSASRGVKVRLFDSPLETETLAMPFEQGESSHNRGHNVHKIPSKMPRVKMCTVKELDSGNIHDLTGHQSHHEGFGVLNIPQRQSSEIKRISERIAKESKRLGSPARRDVKVRLFDSPLETETLVVPLEQGETFHKMSPYSVRQMDKSDESHRDRVWYKRFKAKRLLRRQRERANDLEKGMNNNMPNSTQTFDSLLESRDGDAGLVAILDRQGCELDEYVLLLKDIVFLQKSTTVLPSQSSKIVWLITWLYMLCCSVLSLIYGLGYDDPKFISWLTLFALALLQGILIITPLRLCAVAAICTFINSKEVDIEQWAAYTGPAMRADAVVRWAQLKHKHTLPKDTEKKTSEELHHAPESHTWQLMKSGKRCLAVRQVKRYWLETITWLCIAIFVTTLIIYQRDHRLTRINRRLRETFQEGLENVKTKDDVFDFVDETLVPVFYGEYEISYNEQTKPLGTIRLRQIRVTSDQRCACDNRMIFLTGCNCLASDSGGYYDKANYSLSWSKAGNGSEFYRSPWHYWSTEDNQDTTYLHFGSALQRSIYPLGGYVADFGYTAQAAHSVLEMLYHYEWVDKRTAAVIAEFSLLDEVTGYVTVNLICFELLATGGVSSLHQINSYRPIYIYQVRDVIIVALQVVHLLISLYLLYHIFAGFVEAKLNLLSLFTICTDVWNILEATAIIATFTAYGYYIQHAVSAAAASSALRVDPSRFVSFSKATYCSTMYWNMISFATFLYYIRLLKVLRGCSSVAGMMDTLEAAGEGIASVAVLIIGVTIGFSMSGVMSFAPIRWDFKRIFTASTSLTSVAAGMDISQPVHGVTQNIWWSIYFVLFGFFSLAFYANLYSTIMADALFFTRNEASKETAHPVETLAFHWLYEKAAGYIGIKSKVFSGKRIKLRAPPGLLLHGNLAEQMQKSLTLDPIDGLEDQHSVKIKARSDNIWNRRCSLRTKV